MPRRSDGAGSGGLAGAGGGVSGAGGAPDDGLGLLGASALSVGEAHSCAVAGGRAYCWGNNDDGQLGTGDEDSRTRPERVAGDPFWQRLAVGDEHTCGIDELERVFCWGANRRGQLGLGDRASRSEPVMVSLPNRAALLSADFEHTCALLVDSSLFCWGKNDEGDLGQDDPFPGDGSTAADALRPVQVGSTGFRAVDTGQGHTCAIRLDGTLWCWGRNTEVELGTQPEDGQIRRPVQVGTDADWLDVDAGQHHTCALREDLSLWCWGLNNGADDGAGNPLGLERTGEVAEPTRVGLDADWTEVRTHTFHTCALKRSSDLYCWGRAIEGQLGLGEPELEPRSVPSLVTGEFRSVAVGAFHTCAIGRDGRVSCSGANDAGQLGAGDTERRAGLAVVVE